MQPLIIVGDRTSHGGIVIDGSSETDINGKSVARVGNHATCPIKGHGGTTAIITGDPTLIIDGAPAARHGDKTACGATLLSSQVTTMDEAGGGGIGAARASSPGPPLAMASQLQSTSYDLHFLVKDEKSGSPMANVPYRLTLETGQEITGVTDQQGLTGTIGADSALTAKLEVLYYGDSSSDSYAHDEHGACRS